MTIPLYTPCLAPRVIIHIEGGCVQWAACDYKSIEVIILDADTQSEEKVDAWKEQTIPTSQVEPELLAIAAKASDKEVPDPLDALLDIKRIAGKSDDGGTDPYVLLDLIADRVQETLRYINVRPASEKPQ